MSTSKRSRTETTVEYAGPSGTHFPATDIGLNGLRRYSCKTVHGRKKRLKLESVVRKLVSTNVDRAPFLNDSYSATTGYRVLGSMILAPRWNPADIYPNRTMDFPVYVFRMNVFAGWQSNAGEVEYKRPVIAFKLQGVQSTFDAEWTYRWVPIARASAPTVPVVMNPQIREQNMNATSFRHIYTSFDAIITGATANAADVAISVVKFNDSQFAPPDIQLNTANQVEVFRVNSGYDAAQPDAITEEHISTWYDVWLHNQMAHPLSRGKRTPNATGPPPFTELSRKNITISARSTLSVDQGPIQHFHSHVEKAYRWHNTAVSALGNNAGVWPVNENTISEIQTQADVGIWINPTDQRWMMVQAWTRQAPFQASSPVSTANEPTFDVTMTSKYEFVNEENMILPTLALQPARQDTKPFDPDVAYDPYVVMQKETK